MPGVDLKSVWQFQDFLFQAVVELCGALTRISREVGSTDCPHEESVAGEQKPGLWSPGFIRYEQADALRTVARRVKDFDRYVSQIKPLTVSQWSESEANIRRRMQAVGRAGSVGQAATAGKVVRLDVRVNDIIDLHALHVCELGIGLNVSRLWVHDRSPGLACSTEDVSGAARVVIQKLLEYHRGHPRANL